MVRHEKGSLNAHACIYPCLGGNVHRLNPHAFTVHICTRACIHTIAHIRENARFCSSSANVDPAVFGGKNQSSEFARSFAPFQRSDEEFEKILAFNGVHNQVFGYQKPHQAHISKTGCCWCLSPDLDPIVVSQYTHTHTHPSMHPKR